MQSLGRINSIYKRFLSIRICVRIEILKLFPPAAGMHHSFRMKSRFEHYQTTKTVLSCESTVLLMERSLCTGAHRPKAECSAYLSSLCDNDILFKRKNRYITFGCACIFLNGKPERSRFSGREPFCANRIGGIRVHHFAGRILERAFHLHKFISRFSVIGQSPCTNRVGGVAGHFCV